MTSPQDPLRELVARLREQAASVVGGPVKDTDNVICTNAKTFFILCDAVDALDEGLERADKLYADDRGRALAIHEARVKARATARGET